MREADIFNESVFALSLSENVEVFECKRATSNTHFLYSYVLCTFVCIFPILSKCGYRVVYSSLGHSTTFT